MADRIASALLAAAPASNPQQVADIRRTYAVHVHCGDSNPDRLEQLPLLLMLLGRVFKSVTCNVDPNQFGSGKPRVAVGGIRHSTTDEHAQLVLVLSDQKHIAGRPTVYLDNRGWTAYLSTNEPWNSPRRTPNPIGAQYAAALGAQEAFNRAFGTLLTKASPLSGTTRSCLTVAVPPAEGTNLPQLASIDLDVLLVGVGAVGQAFLNALAVVPVLTGRIDLIDHEAIAPENAERYLFAGAGQQGKSKAAFGRELLASRHPFLQVHTNVEQPANYQAEIESNRWIPAMSPGAGGWLAAALPLALTPLSTYQEYRASDGASPRHIAVAAVDSTQARIDMQFGGHNIVVNPWTDTDLCMRYGVGAHRIGTRACIACQYRSLRKHAPDRYEFYAGLIGWETDRVKPFLDNPSKVLDSATLQELANSLGLDAAQVQAFSGQRLQKFLDAQCAQATIRESDRLGTSPVPHVAALAGIWSAAYVALEALDKASRDPVQLVVDALQPPNSHWIALGQASPSCLCQDQRIPR